MSLEDLRKQAEEEEANEADSEVEETEEEVEEAETDDAEGTDTEEPEEESDDFELAVDGEPEPDQQKPSAEEALIHKLTKQRKRAKEAETEVEALKRELEELKQQVTQPKQPTVTAAEPRIPDLYDKGIEGDREKFNAAMKQWYVDMNAYQNRHAKADQAQADQKQRIESMTKQLATRAAKFATENRVKVDRVADALNTATAEIDAVTGIDGALAYLLDSVGDGSERVAYYIGTNESARSQLKQMLKDEPSGLKAISYMTRLVEKLKPKNTKQISKAPEPDTPLKGDKSSSVTAKRLQEAYDKESDFEKLREIRRKAAAIGVELKTY